MNEQNVKNTFVFNGPVGQVGGHVDVQNIGCTLVQQNGALPQESAEAAEGCPVMGEEEKVRHAIGVMRSEGVLKFAYDYAWVMLVMNQSADMPSFDTPRSFLDYLAEVVGQEGLPSESTLSKKARDTRGRHPAWSFADIEDAREVRRRNNVASRFLSAARKG
jgi:hypothetical protein